MSPFFLCCFSLLSVVLFVVQKLLELILLPNDVGKTTNNNTQHTTRNREAYRSGTLDKHERDSFLVTHTTFTTTQKVVQLLLQLTELGIATHLSPSSSLPSPSPPFSFSLLLLPSPSPFSFSLLLSLLLLPSLTSNLTHDYVVGLAIKKNLPSSQKIGLDERLAFGREDIVEANTLINRCAQALRWFCKHCYSDIQQDLETILQFATYACAWNGVFIVVVGVLTPLFLSYGRTCEGKRRYCFCFGCINIYF